MTEPTDDELRAIYDVPYRHVDGCRDLYNAGRASRDTEVAELLDENERTRAKVDRLHSEMQQMRRGHATCHELVHGLNRQIEELRAQLAEAERGDPDGHVCAVYQVLRPDGSVSDLFDGDEPRYELVIRAAKELRAENERLRAERESAADVRRRLGWPELTAAQREENLEHNLCAFTDEKGESDG